MTNQDIIETAFTEWGKTGFVQTNLTSIAEALKVTKTALYRHFHNKAALIREMHEQTIHHFNELGSKLREKSPFTSLEEGLTQFYTLFFNHYAASIERFYFLILYTDWHIREDELQIIQGINETGNCIFHVMEREKYPALSEPFRAVFLAFLFVTAVFWIMRTLRNETAIESLLEGEKIKRAVRLCLHGISTNGRQKIPAIEDMIRICSVRQEDLPQSNKFFTAIAKTVAEYGMREASMDKIARHLNMQKSSLYFHFANKEKMMSSMFTREQETIESIYSKHVSFFSEPWEKMMCHAFTLSSYLLKKPEMLTTVGWMRMNNLHLKMERNQQDEMDRGCVYLREPLAAGNFDLHGLKVEEMIFLFNLQITQQIIYSMRTGTDTAETFQRIYHICSLFHSGLEGVKT